MQVQMPTRRLLQIPSKSMSENAHKYARHVYTRILSNWASDLLQMRANEKSLEVFEYNLESNKRAA
jgi:hypothetical protein